MNIHILTLFPEIFPGSLAHSIIGKALKNQICILHIHDLKHFAINKQVDDKPYGGSAGMVIKCETVDQAIKQLNLQDAYKIHTSPRGYVFNQQIAQAFTKIPHDLLILCSRYEGVDQRVLDKWDFKEISIGDFVLCGGEVAALVILEACIRLLPGVVGKTESIEHDSHSIDLLEHHQYTAPANWENRKVPEVLLSGDHEKIAAHRQAESKTITCKRRKDLFQKHTQK